MKLKTILKTEYEKILHESKKAKKFSVSHVAGKLLIMFFALILIFTIVSRAVATITVARVTVSNPQKDKLIYSVSGMGKIMPEGEENLTVLPGYRIDDVYVKAGEEVDIGTPIYSYDMEDLQEHYTSIDNEIKKIELLIAEERLRQQPSEAKPSQLDKLSLKQATENLEVAKTRLDKAQKDYDDSKNSTKEKLLESTKKEYNSATKRFEALKLSQEKQLVLSKRAVEDANTALEQAGEIKSTIELLINQYKEAIKSKDRFNIYLAQENIFEAFYGGSEAYGNHKDEVYGRALAAAGSGLYLSYLMDNILFYEERLYTSQEELKKILSSTDPSINSEQNKKTASEKLSDITNSYFFSLDEYEKQISLLELDIDKESSELKKLRKNDKKLKDYLKQLYSSIEAGVDTEAPEKNLFDFVYGGKKKDAEQDMKEKTLAQTRAKEDLALLEKELETQRTDAQAEITELKNDIQSMKDGTYDYEEALEGKKQALEAAKEAFRIAKQAVELNSVVEELPSDQNSIQISELVIQGHTIDLNVKEQERDEVKQLMEDSGEVRSTNKGVVTFVGVENGRRTTGEEIVSLSSGDYVFQAAYDREAAANVVAGVMASIRLEGKRTDIEVVIDKVTMLENGMSEVTARMPEGEYLLGENGEITITSQSEQFDQCIPIQALREDNYGYFVLVTREQEDILGTQLIADRIEVTLLDKGNRTVAVDGALSSKSEVITDSNKYINAGDRIRIDY